MLGRSGENGNRFLFCRCILLMAERMQREQQRPSKRILPKEDRHIKNRNRRIDKNLMLINSRPRKCLYLKNFYTKLVLKKFSKISQLILQFMILLKNFLLRLKEHLYYNLKFLRQNFLV